jgi:hypothetical protein
VSILPRYTVVERELAARPLRGLRIRFPFCVATRQRTGEAPIVRELLREIGEEIRIRDLR